MRQVIAEALRGFGHTTVEASGARETLALHRESPADLIITDLVMKEMDGIELLRRLRTFSQTPVIAISGNRHNIIYLNMAKMLGAGRILAKPFSTQALLDAVNAILTTDDKVSAGAAGA